MQNKCDSADKENNDEIKLNQNNDEIVLKSIDSIKSSKMRSNLDQNVLDII
jgi:hypothetical protein